jgi:toxin ParE1/3/4
MARLIRSPRAKRDIVEVLEYTKSRWGLDQARAYGELIREALVAVVNDPSCGRNRDDVRPGILAYHISQRGRPARHIVFYRIGAGGAVEIVRLLHDAMDFERHLE